MAQKLKSTTGKTWLQTFGMWDVYVQGKLLCSDGRIRKTCRMSMEPDTYFSIPCAIRVKGKTVSGFAMGDTGEEYKFVAYTYGKNGNLLP